VQSQIKISKIKFKKLCPPNEEFKKDNITPER
jgi:hypothetical protein